MHDFNSPMAFGPGEDTEWMVDEAIPPDQQELFEASIRAANAQVDSPGSGQSGLWLLLSLVAFILASMGGFNWQGIALLVAVLFFHEAGHFAGMKLFGYRDVKMFFIPFFGAAVTGKKHAVAAWKEIIVLLLGPLPGLFLGAVLYAVLQPTDTKSVAFQGILMLLLLNAFNLLPFMPLDGGRIMNLLIFRRHPILEVLFKLFAVAGLILSAVLLQSVMLGIIGVLTLISIPFGYQVAAKARSLRLQFPAVAAEWAQLRLLELRQLFVRALELAPGNRVPANVAKRMLMLHEQAAANSPGALATLFYLMVYTASFCAGPAVGLVIIVNLQDEEPLANPVERPTIANLIAEASELIDEAKALRADGVEPTPQTKEEIRELARQASERLDEAGQLLLRDVQLGPEAKRETLQQLTELKVDCLMLSNSSEELKQSAKDEVPPAPKS